MADADRVLSTSEILRLHEEMETKYGDGGGGDFLFGWQSINPFAKDFLSNVRLREEKIDRTKYSYMESDEELQRAALDLHLNLDGVAAESAFCASSGGSSVLHAFSAYLARSEVREVYYVPPIYFSLLNGLRLFGIRARPVSGRHAFEHDFSMNLPDKKTVLIIADPIWYAGIPVPDHVIDQVAVWQRKTGSLIFVDGSFQYMPWNEIILERTSRLDSQNTMRLISPTKSLVIHGYRFAYVLLPQRIREVFSNTYNNICGSSSSGNIAFAHEALAAMKIRKMSNSLINLASKRHEALLATGTLESPLHPSCGYFVFSKVNISLPDNYLKMTGEYFGQMRYDAHARVNLLSTHFYLLEA